MKMVKTIVGLMGSSAASGSTKLSGPDQLRPMLDLLKKHNINEVDTARAYNKGQNEEDLGAIPTAQKDFIIATKAPGFSPGSLAYQKVKDECNASLAALKQDKIDLYYFHGPDSQTPLEESCKAIHELHQEGKIAAFGVSNLSAGQVEEIHGFCETNGWIKPTVYQGMYNGIARGSEGNLFPTLKKFDMSFYAFSPLAGGYFSKTTEQLRNPESGSRMDQMAVFKNMFVSDESLALHGKLEESCQKEGISLKAAALRWLLHHSGLGEKDGIILGGSSTEQMEENLKACEAGPLPKSVADSFETTWEELKKSGKAIGV